MNSPTKYIDIAKTERLLLEIENAREHVINCGRSKDIGVLSREVNHLAFLITSSGIHFASTKGPGIINLVELRRAIKWNGFLLKKLQQSSRKFYFIARGGSDIIFGRTSTNIGYYNMLVSELLEASERAVRLSRNCLKALPNLSENEEL